jgi:hypothetical protein
MSKNQAGKGDKPRLVNKTEYDSNFEKIKWSRSSKKPVSIKKGKSSYKY